MTTKTIELTSFNMITGETTTYTETITFDSVLVGA